MNRSFVGKCVQSKFATFIGGILVGIFSTHILWNFRNPDLAGYRKARTKDWFPVVDELLLDPGKITLKRSNIDHLLEAWDLELPEIFTNQNQVYSQFTCDCPEQSSTNRFTDVDSKLRKFREEDMKQFIKTNYFEQAKMPLVISKANSPIEFVSAGYDIEPDEEFSPYIVIHCDTKEEIEVRLESYFGQFKVADGKRKKFWIELKSQNVQEMNILLQRLRYTPFIYDGRPYMDYIRVKLTCDPGETSSALMPVSIRRRPLPFLTFRQSVLENIDQRVTIVTKSFLRYPCLDRLLVSIYRKYPEIMVVVADDTPKDLFQEIDQEKFPKVKHYRLPEGEGWFAGRALAISQVRTEYFLWVDDDFVFNNETDLEFMVKVADTTGYDVIGGGVGAPRRNIWQERDHFVIERAKEGFCYNRVRFGNTIPLPGFEDDCIVQDVILNFFLGRTSTSGRIRMDPNFENIAHPEYFMDGIGTLRTTWCRRSYIDHIQTGCGESDVYMAHRGKTGESRQEILKRNSDLWYYRNYLQCVTEK